MCACGRKRNQVTTTVQAAQAAEAERVLMEQTSAALVTEAERITASAVNAIGNTRS